MNSVLIDLRYTIDNPYSLMIQLAKQLIPQQIEALNSVIFKRFCPLNEIKDWIRFEALGNATAIRADELVTSFLSYVALESLSLNILLGKKKISSDNCYVLLSLARRLKKLNIKLQITDIEIHNHVVQMFSGFEHVVITYHQQEKENKISMISPDLNAHFKIKETLSEDLLFQYAQINLKIGAFDNATFTLEYLYRHSSKRSTQFLALLQLQQTRLHSHLFFEAANEFYPDWVDKTDKKTYQYIHYLKAYCATMARLPDIAGNAFIKAGVHQEMPADNEYHLYQLNIFALYQVQCKNMELAFTLEKQIAHRIDEGVPASHALRYINLINTARLYRFQKNWLKSQSCYIQAYQALVSGAFSVSDALYYHMNLAGLAERSEAPQLAQAHWFKSAVLWLGMPNPYALAWRPRIALLKRGYRDIHCIPELEEINQFYLDKLKDTTSVDAYLSNTVHQLAPIEDMFQQSLTKLQHIHSQHCMIGRFGQRLLKRLIDISGKGQPNSVGILRIDSQKLTESITDI